MFSSLRTFGMFGCKSLRRTVFPAIYSFRLFTTIGSHHDTDTIYALCSGIFTYLSSLVGSLTKTGVSVIRVSGSNAFDAVRSLTPPNHSFPTIRKATLRDIIDPNTKELIDKGLVLCFSQGARYEYYFTVSLIAILQKMSLSSIFTGVPLLSLPL